MQLRSKNYRLSVLFVLLALTVYIAGSIGCAQAVEEPTAGLRICTPATVSEAAAILDLATLPLVEGAAEPQCRRLACLNYNANGKVAKVFAIHKGQLTDQRWKQLPDAQVSDQFASATFARDGFTLAVSVYPTGMPGIVSVAITHLGNVDLEKLPVPGNAQLIFPGAASVGFVTEMPAEQATQECLRMLLKKGWQPYGTAGDALVLKQNAVRLTARAVAAPGQDGKTMISYSTVLMSADLPAPADASGVQYHDLTTELTFDAMGTPSETIDSYRKMLAQAGWEATTDRPIKNDAAQMLILRNSNHDMLTLETHEVNDKSRVRVKHQSAAEIDELDRQLRDKAKDQDNPKAGG